VPKGANRATQTRPPVIFIADSLGLDFLNSIATPLDTPVDWLDSSDGYEVTGSSQACGWLAPSLFQRMRWMS